MGTIVLYGFLCALLTLVALVAFVVGPRLYRRFVPRTSTTTTTLKDKPLAQYALVVGGVALLLWVIGSTLSHTLESPLPYLIGASIGIYQYLKGVKYKGKLGPAILIAVGTILVLWMWVHPQLLEWLFGPFGTSEYLTKWNGADLSKVVTLAMVAIAVWALWVSGDFFGAVLVLLVLFIARSCLGI